MVLLPAHAYAAEPRSLLNWLWKPLFVLAFAAISWGCGISPGDARVQLGKLGYEFTPASYLTAVDRNDHAAVEYFILAGMEPDRTLTKDTLSETVDIEIVAEAGTETERVDACRGRTGPGKPSECLGSDCPDSDGKASRAP